MKRVPTIFAFSKTTFFRQKQPYLQNFVDTKNLSIKAAEFCR
jgi:hypothetical protein